MQSDARDTPDDGPLYFSRAWKLSMSDVALLDHPNLQQVQVEGLTSFYLLSVGQVNRCVLSSRIPKLSSNLSIYYAGRGEYVVPQ